MRILNLFAGIGGNRGAFGDNEVVAVENDEEIAKIYKDFWPQDEVVVADAYDYCLQHAHEFDFIWASPPCPTHSRMRLLCAQKEGANHKMPDMKLYGLVLWLKHFYKGLWVVENVISYYEPFLNPVEAGKHYFWANFEVLPFKTGKRAIRRIHFKGQKGVTDELELQLSGRREKTGFDLRKYKLAPRRERLLINNCCEPKLAEHILACAFEKKKQYTLNEI